MRSNKKKQYREKQHNERQRDHNNVQPVTSKQSHIDTISVCRNNINDEICECNISARAAEKRKFLLYRTFQQRINRERETSGFSQ